MAVKANKKLELSCILCSHPLTSSKTALNDEVLALIAEQNVLRKTQNDNHSEYNRYVEIDKDQVVATKCGHMFHMGCLRTHVKNGIEKKGTAFCPICTKPMTLTRIWPVLIPPTHIQAAKFKKISTLKEQNFKLRDDLKEIRENIRVKDNELKNVQSEISKSLEDIQTKQSQLDQMIGPSEEELEELRKIHKKRQSIVRVVTKHNAELLELLMHETNVQVSDISEEEKEMDLKPLKEKVQDSFNCSNAQDQNSSPSEDGKQNGTTAVTFKSSESVNELSNVSTATFSEKSAEPRNITAVKKKTWKANRKNQNMEFKVSSGTKSYWEKRRITSDNIIEKALIRREGTREIIKKTSNKSSNKGSSLKKNPQRSKIKPKWNVTTK